LSAGEWTDIVFTPHLIEVGTTERLTALTGNDGFLKSLHLLDAMRYQISDVERVIAQCLEGLEETQRSCPAKTCQLSLKVPSIEKEWMNTGSRRAQ